jgi:hypothetical protein
MNMYSERLQILVSKEQRRRLEREAKRRGASVASVIRAAVDAELGAGSRQAKLAAVDAIRRIPPVPYLEPDRLERAIERSHDEEIARGFPLPPGE